MALPFGRRAAHPRDVESGRPEPRPLTLTLTLTVNFVLTRLDGAPVIAIALVGGDRDAWRVVEPHTLTGRRIVADPDRWPFDPAGYLHCSGALPTTTVPVGR
jgi:hypothetical protein